MENKENTIDFSKPNYKINYDLDFFDKKYNITPEISIEINKSERLLEKLESQSIEKFKKIIKKYPQIPHFKNIFSIYYYLRQNFDKCFEINDELLQTFPEYISAYLNRAVFCFEIDELEQIEEILGEDMEIKARFPLYEEFHISEVITYYKLAVHFLCDVEEFEEAKLRLDYMNQLLPESMEYISTQQYYNDVLKEFNLEKKSEVKE